MMDPTGRPDEGAFAAFLADAEPRLRRALVAAYGPGPGREATADALAWAWEHWERVEGLANPVGYLYRVGQTAARRGRRAQHRWSPVGPPPPGGSPEPVDGRPAPGPAAPWVEPGLPAALDGLSEGQRVAVVLCHGFQWTQREVADLLGVAPTTVQNHVERGLAKLRAALEVSFDG